jgi:hypothetical protein
LVSATAGSPALRNVQPGPRGDRRTDPTRHDSRTIAANLDNPVDYRMVAIPFEELPPDTIGLMMQ